MQKKKYRPHPPKLVTGDSKLIELLTKNGIHKDGMSSYKLRRAVLDLAKDQWEQNRFKLEIGMALTPVTLKVFSPINNSDLIFPLENISQLFCIQRNLDNQNIRIVPKTPEYKTTYSGERYDVSKWRLYPRARWDSDSRYSRSFSDEHCKVCAYFIKNEKCECGLMKEKKVRNCIISPLFVCNEFKNERNPT